MRLCIEAVGGAKIEKVYTLLEQHELAPRMSYDISIGDLHAGDCCHIPVLIWLPKLHEAPPPQCDPCPTSSVSPSSATAACSAASAASPSVEVVRFSLSYVDAVKIDTKSCEACAVICRPMVRKLPRTDPLPSAQTHARHASSARLMT
ncbi:MAG: hypothetical protein SGPRY_005442 [Prymnesium sp.]